MAAKLTQETIFRVRKTRHYVSLNNEMLENDGLSWSAKGMLAYLLSRPGDWVVRIKDLVKRSTEGRDRVYSIMHELIKAGHIVQRQGRDANGRMAGTVYIVYEEPNEAAKEEAMLKEAAKAGTNPNESMAFDFSTAYGFTGAGQPGAGQPGVGVTGSGESDPTNKEVLLKTNSYKETSLRPSSDESDKCDQDKPDQPGNKSPSAKSKRTIKTYDLAGDEVTLAKHLFKRIRERDPKFKEPNINTWARDMDYLMRLDGHPMENIIRVVDWCQNDSFWCTNILSPASLRKQFDRLRQKINMEGEKNETRDKAHPGDMQFRARSDGRPWPEPRIYN